MFSQPAFAPSSLRLTGLDKEEENNNGAFLRLRLRPASGLLLSWAGATFQRDEPGQGWKPHRASFPNTCLIKDLSAGELAR